MLVTKHDHLLGEDDIIVQGFNPPEIEVQSDCDGTFVVLSKQIDRQTSVDVMLSVDTVLAAAEAIKNRIDDITAPVRNLQMTDH